MGFSLSNLFQPFQPSTIQPASRATRSSSDMAENTAPQLIKPVEFRPQDNSQVQTYQESTENAALQFTAPSSESTPSTIPRVNRLAEITDTAPSAPALTSLGNYVPDSDSILDRDDGVRQATPTIVNDTVDIGENLNFAPNRSNSDAATNRALLNRLSAEHQATGMANLEQLRAQVQPEDRSELNTYITQITQHQNFTSQEMNDILQNASNMVNSDAPYPVSGLPRDEVMLSALHDVALPANINQQQVGTCAAGATQMQMAMADPSRYLELVDTLASGETYQSIPGAPLAPDFSFLNETGATLGYRTPSTALVQNALLEYGMGSGSDDYQSRTMEVGVAAEGRNGLYASEIPRMQNALESFWSSGGQLPASLSSPGFDMVSSPAGRDTTATENSNFLNRMIGQTENGAIMPPPLIYMVWSTPDDELADTIVQHPLHALNITGYSPERGFELMNPHGRLDYVDQSDLVQRMRGYIVPGAYLE